MKTPIGLVLALVFLAMAICEVWYAHKSATEGPWLHALANNATTPVVTIAPWETERLKIRWLTDITEKNLRFTTRTYECITEMYSLAYTPPSSGPVCREACSLLRQINASVDSAPPYVDNPGQYRLNLKPGDFCWKRKR